MSPPPPPPPPEDRGVLPRSAVEELILHNHAQMLVKIDALEEGQNDMRASISDLREERAGRKSLGTVAKWAGALLVPYLIGALIHGIAMWSTVDELSRTVSVHTALPGHRAERDARAAADSDLRATDAVIQERQRVLDSRVNTNERDIRTIERSTSTHRRIP